jgi:DNA-binding GntR family transcriptional regulator
MDREDLTAHYYRIAETIRGRIKAQEYKFGDLLPTEKDLEKEFGVSNITIRKALALLVQEGLVVRKRAIGTRVIYKEDKRLAIRISGNFKDWYDSAYAKLKLDVDVLEILVTDCPERIRSILGLRKDEKIWRMKRVRKINRNPISYYINYGPPSLLGKLSSEDFEKRSFIEIFQDRCNIKLSKIEQQVEAAIADMDLASILKVRFGDPLFLVENVYYSTENMPVEVTHMYYRGDRYLYKTTIPLYENSKIKG